jgi:inner membrane protein
MDNLCHTLVGVVLADSGLKHHTARATTTLILASNLPDVDVLVFLTDTLPMSFRRGWTHGVLALALLPAAFAAVMFAIDRIRPGERRANIRGLLLLSCIGTWLHVFMDFLNSYGVRLLMPFSERWFYGDALFIVDPILWAVLGAAVVVARWTRGTSDRTRFPRRALAVAVAYMLLMLASNTWARAEVRDGLVRAGRPAETRFMVTPVLGNPLRREVLIDVGGRYEKGFVWFEPSPHFRPAGYGVDVNGGHPLAQRAAATPLGQAYLGWSRFPFFIVQARPGGGARVRLNDYRYSSASGSDTWLAATVDLPQ